MVVAMPGLSNRHIVLTGLVAGALGYVFLWNLSPPAYSGLDVIMKAVFTGGVLLVFVLAILIAVYVGLDKPRREKVKWIKPTISCIVLLIIVLGLILALLALAYIAVWR